MGNCFSMSANAGAVAVHAGPATPAAAAPPALAAVLANIPPAVAALPVPALHGVALTPEAALAAAFVGQVGVLAHAWRFAFLGTALHAPWVKGDGIVTGEVMLCAKQAMRVAVNDTQKISNNLLYRILVSDGFGSCVPVIVVVNNDVWLHHCGAPGLTIDLLAAQSHLLGGAIIFILNKVAGPAAPLVPAVAAVAAAPAALAPPAAPRLNKVPELLRLLRDRISTGRLTATVRIQVIDVPILATLAVVVNMDTNSVVAFAQL